MEKLGGGEIDPDEPEPPPQEAEKRESRRQIMRTLQISRC